MCIVLGIIKKDGDSGFRIEDRGEVDGHRRSQVVQRHLGDVKGGRKEKTVLVLTTAFCWFHKG